MIRENEICWCVCNQNDFPFEDTVRTTRRSSIGVFMRGAFDQKWEKYYRKGFRCKKVRIVEAK